MQYEIMLLNKRTKEAEWFSDAYLPGIIPDRILPALTIDYAEKWGLCENCGMDTYCHPINEEGFKYCTILFHDRVKPRWKLSEVA